jgi:hypothetical protein
MSRDAISRTGLRHAADNTLLRLYDESRRGQQTAAFQSQRSLCERVARRVAEELRRRELRA